MHARFEDFWLELANKLSSPQTITNWTKDKGPTGEDFEAGPVLSGYVVIRAPSALNEQKVPKKDFKLIYDNWKDYLAGEKRRSDFMGLSRYSKYTISIIHQYQDLI